MKLLDTNLKTCELGTSPFRIETEENQIKLHALAIMVGARGRGKSFFVSNLLGWLKFDRIFIISPTFESNQSQFKHLNIQPEDIFDPDDPLVVEKIGALGNAERDDLIEFRRKKQILKELKKVYGKPSNLDDDYTLFDEYIDPITRNWNEPEHQRGDKRPVMGLFVDDAQSTAIFRNKKFLNLSLKHRHLFSMPGDESSLGLCIIMVVQSYTSTGGSLPRTIRNNATHVGLWRTKSKIELDLISQEMAGEVSPEKFIEIYNYIMSDPSVHTMMFIDLFPKPNHPSMFRKKYTQFVVDEQKSISQNLQMHDVSSTSRSHVKHHYFSFVFLFYTLYFFSSEILT